MLRHADNYKTLTGECTSHFLPSSGIDKKIPQNVRTEQKNMTVSLTVNESPENRASFLFCGERI